MAVLKQCFCYSLRQGSFIIGSYALIVYCVAFAVELWWIVESLLILPAPAYTLCALYFFNFIMAAVLLFGLLVRQRKYLMSWTLMTVLSFFPEAGMVLFMSLYYWPAHKYEYGVIELVYWSLRAMFNIFGAVCVCSLYLTWRDEELILERLHDLTLANVENLTTGGAGILRNGTLRGQYHQGGTLKNSSNLAYQNYAYIDSTATSPVLGDHSNLHNLTYKKSNNSNTFISRNQFGGSRNAHLNSSSITSPGSNNPSNNLRASLMRMKSEFNPALLFDPAYRKNQISELGIAGIGLDPPGQPPSVIGIHRSRSLWNVSNDDYWNRPPPSRPVSMGYVNHAHQLDQLNSSFCHQQSHQHDGTMLKDRFNHHLQVNGAPLIRHNSSYHLRPPSSAINTINHYSNNNNNNNMMHHHSMNFQSSNNNTKNQLLQNHHQTQSNQQMNTYNGGGSSAGGCGLLTSVDRRKNWALAGRRAQSVDGLNNNLFYQRYYGQNISMANPNYHHMSNNMLETSQEWSKSSLAPDDADDIRSYQDIPL